MAAISKGKQKDLTLGNLDAKRDWGYAKEYVEAMWLMLQQDNPDDYVIASGKTYTIRQFVEFAFQEIGVNIVWKGIGVNEVGCDDKTGEVLVRIDAKYFRPSEVDFLWGNPAKAKKCLGWFPKTDVRALCKMMVNYDLKYDDYGGLD